MKNPKSTEASAQKRRLAFLDIDDVLCVHRMLNTRQVLAALAGDVTVNADEVWRDVFHPAAVENLRQLHMEHGLQYVISSSWTLHLSREQLCATFQVTGLDFVAQNLHQFWCCPRDEESCRLSEIEAWLDTHLQQGSIPFVIIDDVISGRSLVGSDLARHTVLCDARAGFMYPQLQAARKVLSVQI
jgi:hypothetical protein